MNPIESRNRDDLFLGPITPFAAIGTLASAPITWLVIWVANVGLYLLLVIVGGVLMFVGGKRRPVGTGIVIGSVTYLLVLLALTIRITLGA